MIINFYKVQNENFIKTICLLVEKAYQSNYKIIIKTSDSLLENEINKTLWTYSQKTFIPHGSSKDPLPEKHPIYITTGEENPNKANLKIFVNSIEPYKGNFDKVLYIFLDNPENNENSRALYENYKINGASTTYHIQETQGWSNL
jgi:DNA polymerase-3 subunit chi